MKGSNAIKKNKTLIFITLIIVVGLFVYHPILNNDFVYDDYFIIVGNPAIQNSTNPVFFFKNPAAFFNLERAGYYNYRPIGTWILSLEFSYFQFNPKFYHGLSIVLHTLNTIILFFIFRHIFSKPLFAFLGSLFFIIHPVQTESVAWGALQPLLWMSFFGFLTILLVLEKGRLSRRIYYLYIPLSFLSVFAKDQLVILPLLLIIIPWYLEKDIKKYLAEITITALATLTYIILRAVFVGSFVQQGLWGGGIYPTILTMSNVFVKYLLLIAKGWPLTINYDDFSITTSLDLKTFFSILLLASLLAFIVFSIKRKSFIALGLAWFFIALLTVTNFPFPLNSLMNERFLYPALPGIIIAVFSLVMLIEKRLNLWKSDPNLYIEGRGPDFIRFRPLPLILMVSSIALLIYYGSITRNRLYDWKDEETLWKSALKLSPHVRNWLNYTRALQINGKYEEALKEYLTNGEKYSRFSYYYANDLKDMIHILPKVPTVNEIKNVHAVRLANLYARMKKFNEAEETLKPRLRTVNSASTRKIAVILNDIYMEAKKYDEAEKILRNIVKEWGTDDEILFDLALLDFLKNGDLKNMENYSENIRSQNLKKIMPALLLAYKEKEAGNWKNVSLLLIPALTLNPISIIATPYFWLGEAEIAQKKLESAKQVYYSILRIDPASTDARIKLMEINNLQKR